VIQTQVSRDSSSNGNRDEFIELTSGDSGLSLDSRTGAIASLRLGNDELIKGSDLPGPFRLHVPLEDYVAHTIDAHRTRPQITRRGDTLTCRYANLMGKRGPIAVEADVEVRGVGDGTFELRLRLANNSTRPIEQAFFPWIGGFGQIDGVDDQVTWGRSEFFPWRTWGDASDKHFPKFMNYSARPQISRHCGQPYQTGMKWMDFGGRRLGVSLYSQDTGARNQYMFVDTPSFGAMILDLAWYTYPFIEPGKTWQSKIFVLYPHVGDWRRGVMKFKEFTDKAFVPVTSPPALDETLGQYTFWISMHLQDWQDVKYRFSDLPAIAAEARRAGFNQMTIVRATALDFCLPHVIREPLGSSQELKAAVSKCRELGVNVIPFVTCRLIRADTVPPGEQREWFKEDIAGARQYSNWTYDPTMTPTMPLRQNGARAAYITCAGSKGWRRAFFENVEMMGREWDFRGFLFDVSFDWTGDLCFNPLHNHDCPDEDPQCLADALRQARQQLIGQFSPDDVVISGECQWDVATGFQDLTWDWATLGDRGSVERHVVTEAFDMAFPRSKSCTKCTTDRNQINRVFVSGRLIEMYLEEGVGRLGDYPQLTEYLGTLSAFKKRFQLCLAHRDSYLRDLFIGLEPGDAALAHVHRHGDQALVMIANMSRERIHSRLTINLSELLGAGRHGIGTWSRTLENLSTQEADGEAVVDLTIPAEDFVGVHLTPLA
jgi:hypothetical protein